MGCGSSSVPLVNAEPQGRLSPQLGFLSSPRVDVDVTKRGVRLSFMRELVASGEIDIDYTIQEVVDKFVRPRSAATRCCLFDLVPLAATGRPGSFISHTWSRKIGDLLALLDGHFGKGISNEDPIIWLDIFAINQHPYEARGALQNDDVANLAKVVAATDVTLFCLDSDCVSLTRIWCLFEVLQTFLAKGAKGLFLLTEAVNAEKLNDIFETFDIRKAQATQPEDRDRILGEIEQLIGGTSMNLQLKSALVQSAVVQSENPSLRGLDVADACEKAGFLLSANGLMDKAELKYQKVLAVRTELLGADDEDTITSLINLAKCYSSQGREEEAEPMLRKGMESRVGALGSGEDQSKGLEDAFNVWNLLAICVNGQGRYDEAEALYREALEACARVLGPDNLTRASLVNNLAECLGLQEKYGEAEALYRQAFDVYVRILGTDHPDTISALSNLAMATKALGNETAESLFRQALDARLRVLGPDHPDSIASLLNLAICIKQAPGRDADAELLLRQVVEAKTRLLGPNDTDTINSVSFLAICIKDQGRYKDAEPLFRQALEAKERLLGPDDSQVGDAAYTLGCLLEEMEQLAAAKELFLSAAKIYKNNNGLEHESTQDALTKANKC